MGHRKKHAPKRGSLSYLPRKRAKSLVGKVRFWPDVDEGPKLLGFVGYKAGMTHVIAIDNKKGSITYGKEVSIPATLVETPPTIVFGIRAYSKTEKGLKTLSEVWMEKPPKDIERLITAPKKPDKKQSLEKIQSSFDKINEIRLIIMPQPRFIKIGRKKPELIEIKIGGGNIEEQFKYATEMLGKEVKLTNVFQEGELVDTIAITKGKGIQGPVKRWGIKRLPHKSRKTIRGVGSIGPWKPSIVMYSVPRAGQMGFHQRTEYNKQILKIGDDGSEITPKGAFPHYGMINAQYALLKGSIAGSTKRLVIMRCPARSSNGEISLPKIEYIDLESKQGD